MTDAFYKDDWLQIFGGDCRDILRGMPAGSVQSCVTSPPFYSLRDYGVEPTVWGGDTDHQHEWAVTANKNDKSSFCACGAWLGALGLEPTPWLFIEHLVEVFAEVWRVLRDDGTLWLNLGDTWAAERSGTTMPAETLAGGVGGHGDSQSKRGRGDGYMPHRNASSYGIRHKNLIGIPWRTAFALQDFGWNLRADIIWSKVNPMPASVRDRPTLSHEYVFLLTKKPNYFYDIDAIREPNKASTLHRVEYSLHQRHPEGANVGMNPIDTDRLGERFANPLGRNSRSVWEVNTESYRGAHYAPWPQKLVEPMIKAGTSERGCCPECGAPWERITKKSFTGKVRKRSSGGLGTEIRRETHGLAAVEGEFQEGAVYETVGWKRPCEHEVESVPCTVLDPFAGSGTTGLVAQRLSRKSVLIDLNPEYLEQQFARTRDIPLGL